MIKRWGGTLRTSLISAMIPDFTEGQAKGAIPEKSQAFIRVKLDYYALVVYKETRARVFHSFHTDILVLEAVSNPLLDMANLDGGSDKVMMEQW